MSLADKSCDVPLMVWGEAIKTDRRHSGYKRTDGGGCCKDNRLA
ncbi:hypothetical protein M076_4988 [Bacteroides fragilis str. 2-F-2 |uniref:Uncharacterized protein n=1 Tax=Bacteroides fragilis str. 2-F-2 \|nr:hypothetical protein M078_3974 [Bacteroides fragilis str. 2-F-2 \